MSVDEKQGDHSTEKEVVPVDLDLATFHEKNAGRLVIDPAEAAAEFGEEVASRLKLSSDGTKVLWPQPSDSPNDPQNWTNSRKSLHLFIITLAAIVPDFDSGIGIAALFPLAKQFHTSTDAINNLTSNWSIFLLGWGGIVAVMVVRRYGRLPVLFWSQVLALGFLIGATVAPNLKTFAAMRCLTAFFGTTPQVTGLYIITDMYPFHLQAKQLNVWTMGFIISPFLSPFACGFLAAKQNWRWAYSVGCFYSLVVVILIAFFFRESMYDRTVKPIPEAPTKGLRARIETLVGITGYRMAKYRSSWKEAIWSPLEVCWRPHVLSLLIFEGAIFGFGIGINVTTVVFLGTPPPVGLGLGPISIAAMYATPIVSIVIGELTGHFTNEWIQNLSIRKNKGVFEAESRLWACYIAVPLFVCGFLVIGAAFQKHLSLGAVIMGWGIAELSIMINTVAVYAYLNDAFPRHQGEISALIDLARTLGGFAVPYFQVPWATKRGALETYGVEAAIIAGLFLLFVPLIQIKGRELRHRFSLHG